MGIQIGSNLIHWNYFIALEHDLSTTSRFIEFCDSNLNVYSIELVRLLLSSSSEVDVVLKAFCNVLDPGTDHQNINDYQKTVVTHCPDLVDETIHVPKFSFHLQPWTNWKKQKNPDWWRAYNKVKHERNDHFSDANLKNTLNSLAALAIVVLYYYRQVAITNGASVQFRDVTRQFKPEAQLLNYDDSYVYHSLIV